MNSKKILDGAGRVIGGVKDRYSEIVKNKAIESVNQKILDRGLRVEDISAEDYEMMVSEAAKDVKMGHTKKAAQGMLAVLGFDLLFGF